MLTAAQHYFHDELASLAKTDGDLFAQSIPAIRKVLNDVIKRDVTKLVATLNKQIAKKVCTGFSFLLDIH